jgi:hypothetical protein
MKMSESSGILFISPEYSDYNNDWLAAFPYLYGNHQDLHQSLLRVHNVHFTLYKQLSSKSWKRRQRIKACTVVEHHDVYFPKRYITVTCMLTAVCSKTKERNVVAKKMMTMKCTWVKYNVLTLLAAGLCSVMSRMSGSYFGTCFLHCCWVYTAGFFGTQWREGLAWVAWPLHTHYPTGLTSRIQTFYRTSVRHNTATAAMDLYAVHSVLSGPA